MKKYSIRSQFHAKPGHTFIQWDLKQAEFWVAAWLAGDPNMKESLLTGDPHRDTAANALYIIPKEEVTTSMRYMGKRSNFAFCYRMGPPRATQVINQDSDKPPFLVISLKEARIFHKRWHGYYPRVEKVWWKEIEEKAANNRTMINTYGVIHVFFEKWGQELYKQMTAWEPQSTVAYHMNGMVHPELGIEGGILQIYKQFVIPGVLKIVQQGHDSVVCEVPNEAVDDVRIPITNLLERPLVINREEFTIPVETEVGEVWGEMEEVK